MTRDERRTGTQPDTSPRPKVGDACMQALDVRVIRFSAEASGPRAWACWKDAKKTRKQASPRKTRRTTEDHGEGKTTASGRLSGIVGAMRRGRSREDLRASPWSSVSYHVSGSGRSLKAMGNRHFCPMRLRPARLLANSVVRPGFACLHRAKPDGDTRADNRMAMPGCSQSHGAGGCANAPCPCWSGKPSRAR